MCSNIVMVASNQTNSMQPQPHEANPTNTTTIASQDHRLLSSTGKHKAQNSPQHVVRGGGFLRCEHCCESMAANNNSGGQNNGLKHTSSYSAMYQPSDTETVSELSSYRFVTDEDLELVVHSKCSNDSRRSYRGVGERQDTNSHTLNVSRTPSSVNCVNYYDDSDDKRLENDRISVQQQQYTNNHELYSNNNNNNNYYYKNIYKNNNNNEIEAIIPNESEQKSCNNNESVSSKRRPEDLKTNCCYSIDKSPSDNVIYYQAFAVTEPLKIPSREPVSKDDLLSSSLPRNYGSDFDTNTFTRQLYLRQSLRSYRNGPPPVPPKPSAEENTSEPSYDPQRFYRKLQRFEKQNSVINQTVQRDSVRNTQQQQERSITPERCELLNCFPSYRSNRLNNAKDQLTQNNVLQNPNQDTSSNGSSPYYNNNNNNGNYSCRNVNVHDFGSSPKRTLRYDNHGRLKSAYISQLPIKRNSLETVEQSQRSFSQSSLKLTPTLTRKFTYTPKHTITTQLTEVPNEEEYETNDKTQKNNDNAKISIIKKSESLSQDNNPVKSSEDHNPPTIREYENLKEIKENQKENHNRKDNVKIKALSKEDIKHLSSSESVSAYNSKSKFIYRTEASPPNSPTSPTRLIPPKKSHSSPLVLIHHDGCVGGGGGAPLPSSPVWLSSETIESQTSSSQRCLDETQSNCSDQTTIFHFEQDCSSSSSPSNILYGSATGQPSSTKAAGQFLKGSLQVRHLPAIQSFGYIPTHSSSLGSANVREYIEKEVSNISLSLYIYSGII